MSTRSTEHRLAPGMKAAAPMSDEDIMLRACKQYERHCKRNGALYDQPSTTTSEVTRRRVVLANVRGKLATFARRAAGKLVMVEQE